MKKTIVMVLFILLMIPSFYAKKVSKSHQVANLSAFSRLYGYARHFQPSDEAQEISWNRFAIYGTQQVINAKDNAELQAILLELFTPIVPTLRLYSGTKDRKFETGILIPPDKTGYKLSCWQYVGFNDGKPGSVYNSLRTNRPFKIYKDKSDSVSRSCIEMAMPPIQPAFQKTRLTFSIARASTDTNTLRFVTEFDTLSRNDSLSTYGWQKKTYLFENPDPAAQLFRIMLENYEKAYVDSIRCEVFRDNAWTSLYYNDFSADIQGKLPSGINTDCSAQSGYITANNDNSVENLDGNNVLCIQVSKSGKDYTLGYMNKIFDEEVPFGKLLDKPLIKGMSCLFPMSLYSNYEHTYPAADTVKFNRLKSTLEPIDLQASTDLYARLAALCNYWNQLYFFYPYWQYARIDWEKELPRTIKKILEAPDFNSYKYVMQELKSKTLDCHAFMYSRGDTSKMPGFNAGKFGKDWIVTVVADDSLDIPLGSEVTLFNGKPMGKYLENNRKYFTFASRHKTDKMLFNMVMEAYPDSTAAFTFVTPEAKKITRLITFREYEHPPWYDMPDKIIQYTDGIYYVNTAVTTDAELNGLLPDLSKARGIIFDTRTYPAFGTDLISNLLVKPDTMSFFHIRRYIYPREPLPEERDRRFSGWKQKPREPHLDAKIVFLTSAFSISYCESFLQEIKANKLGTLIGQPTAGTTGNVNGVSLPTGLYIMWTGMFIDNQDGSRFHGIGVIPDIYVKPTREAVVKGRDQELDTALDYLKAELKLPAVQEKLK